MASPLEQIQQVIHTLKLDDSLFLNHVLAVARGERRDAVVEQHIRPLARELGVIQQTIHY
jgi:hypothetical protein